jgi:hypothetical protein
MKRHSRRCSFPVREERRATPESGKPDTPDSPRRSGPGYSVRILYTEPEFQRRNPGTPPFYSFKLRYVGVTSPQEALDRALEYYESCYRNSGVNWLRVIQSVILEPF